MKPRLLALLLIGSFIALYCVGSDGLFNPQSNQPEKGIRGINPISFSDPMLIDSRIEITEAEIVLGDLYEEITLISNEIRILKETMKSLEQRITSLEYQSKLEPQK